MTYPFRFTDIPTPRVDYGEGRHWGGLAVRRLKASPGLHDGGVFTDHRLLFYLSPGVTTECACDGLKQRRIHSPADFDVVPAGADGSWEDDEPMEMVSVRLAPGLLTSIAEGLETPGGRAELTPRLGGRDPLIEHLMRALIAEIEAPHPASRLYADGLAAALTTRLLQDLGPKAPKRQILSKPQLRRIVEYVEEHLDGELTLAELSEVVGISVPHLTTLFRRTMGQSVHAYVMERRVCRARTLLLSGQCGIAEAALEAGFAHQSHLARWMRRLLGVTPGQVLRA